MRQMVAKKKGNKTFVTRFWKKCKKGKKRNSYRNLFFFTTKIFERSISKLYSQIDNYRMRKY